MHAIYSFIYEHRGGEDLRWWKVGFGELWKLSSLAVVPFSGKAGSPPVLIWDCRRRFAKMFVDSRGVVHWAQHSINCQALSGKDTYGLMENHYLGSP